MDTPKLSLDSASLLRATISQLSTLLIAVLLPPPDSSAPPPLSPGGATPGPLELDAGAQDATPGVHDVGYDPGASETDAGVDFPWLVATRRAYRMPEFCQASKDDVRLEHALADLSAVMSFPTRVESVAAGGSFLLSLDTVSQQERDALWRVTLATLAEELRGRYTATS